MSEKLPRISVSDVIRALEKAGFFLSRQSGSHKIYYFCQRLSIQTSGRKL